MKFSTIKFSGLILFSALFLFSCNNDEHNEPPQLPSSASMKVDMSEMESASNKTAAKRAESNFNTAVFAAGVAKVILEANLAIPRALITAAQDQTAEAINDSEFEWTYSSAAGGQNFSIRLVATVQSSQDVDWNFFVSSSAAGIEDQLFFSGTSNFDGTMGTWTYYNLQTGDKVSDIDWEVGENATSIDFEVISDRNDNRGDTISYNFEGNTKTVVYFDASKDETSTVSYNTETLAGFIISANYNGGAKSCWDENLNNTTCSE
jgi:hypothetical protein